ncbi:hypothetical protein JI435_413260 [Parastagonospora nodorum SN15]|uniref:Uncharacterized protein n=1 Tax=Phaeosphaeria nodorum (strain SN15 / ATCC MYA-4574 / FGSC 10173) TaxID=321614 RepID=A0A7U2F635_PHANO|nr:hypothetical protein JI435_413260 [Parastagonospora nodorum SN15]
MHRNDRFNDLVNWQTLDWWRWQEQAENGNRGSCCTTVYTIRALTVVNVKSDSCSEA